MPSFSELWFTLKVGDWVCMDWGSHFRFVSWSAKWRCKLSCPTSSDFLSLSDSWSRLIPKDLFQGQLHWHRVSQQWHCWRQIILCGGGCPVPRRMFSSIPGLYPPSTKYTTTPSVSRHCRCPLGIELLCWEPSLLKPEGHHPFKVPVSIKQGYRNEYRIFYLSKLFSLKTQQKKNHL